MNHLAKFGRILLFWRREYVQQEWRKKYTGKNSKWSGNILEISGYWEIRIKNDKTKKLLNSCSKNWSSIWENGFWNSEKQRGKKIRVQVGTTWRCDATAFSVTRDISKPSINPKYTAGFKQNPNESSLLTKN